jgi:hypothetical protein
MTTVTMTDFSSGKMTLKNSPDRAGPVDDRRLVEVPGNGGDEGAEQQDAERQPEGDLDEDEAPEGLEQPEALEHPHGRDDRGRDDEPGQHQEVDHAVPAALPALDHVGHHGGQHDQDGHAGHGEHGAVDEGDDQHVVPGAERVTEVLEQRPGGGQRELELSGLVLGLGRGEHDEGERNEEHDREQDDLSCQDRYQSSR